MDDLINNDPDPETTLALGTSRTTGTTGKILKPHRNVKSYYNVLLTRNGIDKIKHTNKSIFDLPLADLRDPPHIAQIYTIGDLVRFIDKHQYIKNAVESYED